MALRLVHGTVDVVHLEAGAGAFDSSGIVGRVEAAKPDTGHRGAASIAGGLALLDDGVQVGAGIGIEALAGDEIRGLQQRALMVGLELEDLLEDGRGFDELAFFAQRVGDLQELFDRLVDLAGARVEIAERVRRVPVVRLVFDNAQVFCDSGFEFALPKQLPQRFGVWRCDLMPRGGLQSLVSNAADTRNDRRCTSE